MVHCVRESGRTDQGLKPRFVKVEPPSDADITRVLQQISRRVIRKLRHLGYLKAGIDAAVATGYDPLLDNESELAHTMAASVKQLIAFGERAGQKVRRIGSGFGYEGEIPELMGPRCASLGGFRCTPTPMSQRTGVTSWSWARLLGRVFALDMATCPFCRRGALRIIAAITQESVITLILRHLKLASVPPPIAPARSRQERFDWVA